MLFWSFEPDRNSKIKKQRILLKKRHKNGCSLKKNMIYYKSDF